MYGWKIARYLSSMIRITVTTQRPVKRNVVKVYNARATQEKSFSGFVNLVAWYTMNVGIVMKAVKRSVDTRNRIDAL